MYDHKDSASPSLCSHENNLMQLSKSSSNNAISQQLAINHDAMATINNPQEHKHASVEYNHQIVSPSIRDMMLIEAHDRATARFLRMSSLGYDVYNKNKNNGISQCHWATMNCQSNSIAMASQSLNMSNGFAAYLSTHYDTGYHRNQHHYHEDQYQSHRRHKHKGYKKIAASLGILGLFQGKSSEDIEEQRENLSDEEKIARMSPLELTIAKGVLAMCDSDHAKASALFHEALLMAQSEQDLDQEFLILNLLATNFYEMGDYASAELLFVDLIRRMLADEVDKTDPAILELSLKLANMYSKSEDPELRAKASPGFNFVIDSLLNRLGDLVSYDHDIETLDMKVLSDETKNEIALLGWSYDWFGKHLFASNDYKAATRMFKRALVIATKVLGETHEQTLILMNDVGTSLAVDNSLREAETYVRGAVEGAIKSQSQELASFYVNLGLISYQLNKLDEARRYCEYSIEVLSKNSGHYNAREILNMAKNCIKDAERLMHQ